MKKILRQRLKINAEFRTKKAVYFVNMNMMSSFKRLLDGNFYKMIKVDLIKVRSRSKIAITQKLNQLDGTDKLTK